MSLWLESEKGDRIINKPSIPFVRANFNIVATQVRVVDQDGKNLGVLPIKEARNLARQRELDLIEIVPQAKPPVCKLGDFQKFRYELKLKRKEDRAKSKSITMKEIRLRYCTNSHDLEVKEKAIRKFLQEKRQVRVYMMFKPRELNFKDQGFALMNSLLSKLADIAKVDLRPKMTGRNLVTIISPQNN